mmetsp:Transcript_4025/g.5270  ORF Transcript_4025/g.5270 Transcript_4025/m.5270 type:complete len:343 (+) Transcript_4025:3-1031(+)
MHLCLPSWKGVSYMVTKQLITFNALSQNCPTRDNVYVNINISVNFRIGPDIERVSSFVFQMGAEKLDAYLALTLEEGMRTLVYGVNHDKVNDLRSEFAAEMLRTLTSKASRFGVTIINVKVTDVSLPKDLQDRLEKTTAFRTKITEEQKNHEHALYQLTNSSEQQFAEIEQSFKIKNAQLSAQAERYEIEMDEKIAAAISDRTVQLEKARGAKQVALVNAKGEIAVAEYEGRAAKQDTVESMRIRCDSSVRSEQVNATNQTAAAAAEKDSANLLAQARITEAQAEGLVAEQSQTKILFEDRMVLAQLDAQVAERGRKILGGQDGAEILSSLVSVRSELMQRA